MFRPKRLLRAFFLSVLSNYEQWKLLRNANGMETLQVSRHFALRCKILKLRLHSAN